MNKLTLTKEEILNWVANTVYEPEETTVPGKIHTYGQIPGLNSVLNQALESYRLSIEKDIENLIDNPLIRRDTYDAVVHVLARIRNNK